MTKRRFPAPAALGLVALLAGIGVAPAHGATPAATAAGLAEARAACRKASGLRNAVTRGEPLVFSDAGGAKTAVLVTGTWRPRHMKNARATMLCLYDRRSRVAETTESVGWTAPGR